jgi:hypothetical protein
MAPFEEAKEESRKETDRLLAATFARVMPEPPFMAERLEEIRVDYGEDFLRMVEDFMRMADGN